MALWTEFDVRDDDQAKGRRGIWHDQVNDGYIVSLFGNRKLYKSDCRNHYYSSLEATLILYALVKLRRQSRSLF